jgi:hypothetical protein
MVIRTAFTALGTIITWNPKAPMFKTHRSNEIQRFHCQKVGFDFYHELNFELRYLTLLLVFWKSPKVILRQAQDERLVHRIYRLFSIRGDPVEPQMNRFERTSFVSLFIPIQWCWVVSS